MWTLSTDKVIATIPDTKGVHGIAVANDLGKGFTSNGKGNDVTIFDLKTSKPTGNVKTGQNPDSIIYEPVTHRVFTFNGKSKDSTVFDAKTGEIVSASLALGGKPEFAQVDGKGHVYANLEDKNEIVEINAKDATVTKHYSIAPCDSPSGLAIDPKKNLLFSVCDNKVMVVSDPATGKVVASPAIGEGPDGVAFDDGYAFSANGKDGNITMVGENGGKYEAVATIPTQIRARTIGADQKAHKLYLPTAEYGRRRRERRQRSAGDTGQLRNPRRRALSDSAGADCGLMGAIMRFHSRVRAHDRFGRFHHRVPLSRRESRYKAHRRAIL